MQHPKDEPTPAENAAHDNGLNTGWDDATEAIRESVRCVFEQEGLLASPLWDKVSRAINYASDARAEDERTIIPAWSSPEVMAEMHSKMGDLAGVNSVVRGEPTEGPLVVDDEQPRPELEPISLSVPIRSDGFLLLTAHGIIDTTKE